MFRCPTVSTMAVSSREFQQDLLSLGLGLASLSLFKYTWPDAFLTGIEATLLLASGALCSAAAPLLTLKLTRVHLSDILDEKAAHLCLFLASQGLAFCSLLALGRTDLGDHRALAQLSTVITPMLSYYVLDSSLDPRQILLLPLSFVGVVLICRPTEIFESGTLQEYMEDIYGVFLALGAAIFQSMVTVSLRAIQKTPPELSVWSASAASILLWFGTAAGTGASFGPCHRGTILTICACFLAGSIVVHKTPWCQTRMLRTALCIVEVAFAYGLQFLLVGRIPHWCSGLGALVVALCSLACVLCQDRRSYTSSLGSDFSVSTSRKISTSSQFSESTRKISTGTQDARMEALMSVHLQLRFPEKEKAMTTSYVGVL